ncbi:MAG: hypothetical protein V8Q36_10020, partial [Anaerotignum sp.]
MTIGSLSGLKIDNMREQHNNIIDFTASEKKTPVEQARAAQPVQEERPKKDIGFVSISAGSGLTAIFHNLGVDEVIEGGQTMNPSTEASSTRWIRSTRIISLFCRTTKISFWQRNRR